MLHLAVLDAGDWVARGGVPVEGLALVSCSSPDPVPRTAGVCGMYEKLLQDLNPGLPTLTYDVADLFGFLDSLSELSMLVWDRGTGTYLPRDRAWIKSATQRQLQSIATGKPR